MAVSWVLMGPATVWAQDDGFCSSSEIREASSTQLLSAATNLTGQRPSSADSPCDFDQYDSPAYNVCFVTNPRPVSTMPKWLARFEAGELASRLFDNVGDFFEESGPVFGQPDTVVSVPPRLEAALDRLRAPARAGSPGRACFEQYDGEECKELPSEAGLVTAGSVSPILRFDEDVEIPFYFEDDHQSQRPLVRLRVGPSIGHDTPPDRPPPV